MEMMDMQEDRPRSNQEIIVARLEQYLRQYPAVNNIEHFQGVFKMTHTYSSPYTDSKNNRESYLFNQDYHPGMQLHNGNRKLLHNAEKGSIEEAGTFDSIMTKAKHQKVMQDDVFGKAEFSADGSKWVYLAEIKQEEPKSYFNGGTGKAPYKNDFGETYDNVREVGIFLWDKQTKKVFRIPIADNLIPCYPSFDSHQGTRIVFHVYERVPAIEGLTFCFNRTIRVFQASYTLAKEAKETKEGKEGSKEDKVEAEVAELFANDQNTTKLLATVSPCFKYLIYLSGTGKTHTFYKDLVICKRKGEEWIETHRHKEAIIGYNSTLKTYIFQESGKSCGIIQNHERSCSNILRIDLESGELTNLTDGFKSHCFQITSISQGVIVGTVTTNNFNSFFWIQQGKVRIVEPGNKEQFIEKEYLHPIHAILVSAPQEDVWPEYQFRKGNRPLAVMPHGGPHGSFAHAFTSLRYMLLKMGYFLLHPNFSGSAGYGKQFLEATLGKAGERDAQEIVEVVQTVLKDHPEIDRSKVHTQGGSYGGYLSAILGARYPDSFSCTVILNGVINLIANMWFADIPKWNTVEALGSSQLHDLTAEDYQAMWRQSPSSQPLKVPTLQLLGGKDRRVPYRQGLFLDAITKGSGGKITTHVYENSGHSLSDSVETMMDIVVKVLLFVEGQDPQNPYAPNKG